MPILPKRALGAALLLFAVGAAHAQYVWIGPNGTRQYSDRPPPPNTPASKIIKAPGKTAFEAAPAAGVEPIPAADAKGPPTLAEREAAFRERSKEREAQAMKNREEAERKRRQDEHCASARETQAQLTSGIRLAKVGPNGEQSFMSDEEKAVRTERVNRALAECRQAAN